MNISLWSFTGIDRSLGRVRDLIANNVIDVKTSARHQHLTTTVGNKIEVDLRSAGTGDVVIFDIDGKSITEYDNVNSYTCHLTAKTPFVWN